MSDVLADDVDTPSKPERCVVEHCYYAFDTLYCTLTKEDPIDEKYFQEYLQGELCVNHSHVIVSEIMAGCLNLKSEYLVFNAYFSPLFVTWNTVSSRLMGGVRLRGCIGNFEPMGLEEGVKEYALISALHDHRFRPIEEKELRKLECCVSLLTDFEDAESYLDWEVGTHGIYITLTLPILPAQSTDDSSAPSPMSSSTFLARSRPLGRQRKLTATYLPDVIPAQGWTKQEAVDSALRKAGFDGRITEEVRRAVKLRRYQSSVASVRWDKFWEWRKGVTSRST
ncbi:hypothetical protein FRC08_006136 [Ceratobasidium sp. 394]|nr:hypothetical protein FRC08_006136 [Ceratobasidium sp. 394]